MKRIAMLSLVLTLVLMLGALTACGGPSGDPTPAPEGHPLIGSWVWDQSDGYVYVFNANGEGTRGGTPITESFHWRVEGNDHLLMETAIMEESWTFVINNDVLTITSRQAANMQFSYIRMD
ncbi:MAG: hypothetical protein FWC76_06365 [Defluviitaleaceae bacterium]|nr:hypothetical protein [Defluviitaleaceae bacterium]